MPRIDVTDCVLVVIDAQPGFYGADRHDVDRDAHAAALARAAWVAGVAAALRVPIVVTEEDAHLNGPTDPAIRDALPDGTPVLDKAVFGACDQPDIDVAVRAPRRGTVVLVGTETDVCVAHSALGWRATGLRPVVIHDAVHSAGPGHLNGLRRLAADGVELLSAKELYYEWLRTLAEVRDFERQHPELAQPPGFHL
ncbi:MAG: isochorismatase family protein [Actinomycetales bacterium]|nr:isochorismatase family protein [Actinomycetales bacterium]